MKIVVIDIETTGFLNEGGNIVEVAAVELDLTNGNIDVLLNYVVHEDGMTLDKLENSWIIKNSDLSINNIRYSLNFKYIVNILNNIAIKYPVTAFNRKFDISFLESRNIKFKELYPCPMLELTPILKLPHKNGRKGNKWPNVEEAYKHFFPNENYVEKHRACDDALHEAKIIYELYKLQHNVVENKNLF